MANLMVSLVDYEAFAAVITIQYGTHDVIDRMCPYYTNLLCQFCCHNT